MYNKSTNLVQNGIYLVDKFVSYSKTGKNIAPCLSLIDPKKP